MPGLIVAILITQVPFLVTIYYSFQNWNLARPEERSFAGFDNYIAVVTGGVFLPSLWATIWIVGGSMILSMLLGLFFAMLLDRKFPGRSLARTLLITPFLIMPAAAALLWKYSLLDADSGIVTWVLSWFGLAPDRLDDRPPGAQHRLHPDLAVHAVHDADPAGRAAVAIRGHPRGGRRRRLQRPADVPLHDAAAPADLRRAGRPARHRLDGAGLRPRQHHDQGCRRHQDPALPALRTGLHRATDR